MKGAEYVRKIKKGSEISHHIGHLCGGGCDSRLEGISGYLLIIKGVIRLLYKSYSHVLLFWDMFPEKEGVSF
jgi:hypothetical protein